MIRGVHLEPGEEIVLVLRKHWFIFLAHTLAVCIAFFLGALALAFLLAFDNIVDASIWEPILYFLFSLFSLFLVESFFISWVHLYYDIWIVTNRRIIDIEQKSLFNREISEFMIGRVQDVTTDVPSLFATLLGYGNITIQTAGEMNFTVHSIPRLEAAKELILRCAHKEQK